MTSVSLLTEAVIVLTPSHRCSPNVSVDDDRVGISVFLLTFHILILKQGRNLDHNTLDSPSPSHFDKFTNGNGWHGTNSGLGLRVFENIRILIAFRFSKK